MDHLLVLLLALFSGRIQSQELKENPSVSITTGDLFGVVEKSFSGLDYFSFKGIPFAEPPLRELRFKPPVPKKPWTDIFNATVDGSSCIQLNQFDESQVIGSEDCLLLNVYTKNLAAKTKQDLKPVLVFIHGGRWLVGSGSSKVYSPYFLMDQDLVVVSIQYRLGAFGFLSTEDSVAPGNYGLLDQVEALKWVQANIQSFGGNPDKVTAIGQSAGGVSTHFHMLSPLSKGLIHGGFAMSGNAALMWSNRYTTHNEVAKKHAELVSCPSNSSELIIDCLRNVDAEQLTRAQSGLHDYFGGTAAKIPLFAYFPRPDKESENPFLPDFGNEMLKRGEFEHLPLVLGITSQESAWYAATLYGQEELEKLQIMDEDIYASVDSLNSHFLNDEQVRNVSSFYLNDQPMANLSMLVPFCRMMSDGGLNFETIMAAYYHARQSTAPVFSYNFFYRGQWSFAEEFEEVPRTYDGVAHVDDLRYLVRMPFGPEYSEEEIEVMRRYTGYVAELATYGKPTGGNPEKVYNLEWAPYQQGNGLYMIIDTVEKSRMTKEVPFESNDQPGRMEFWQKIYGYTENFFEDFKPIQN